MWVGVSVGVYVYNSLVTLSVSLGLLQMFRGYVNNPTQPPTPTHTHTNTHIVTHNSYLTILVLNEMQWNEPQLLSDNNYCLFAYDLLSLVGYFMIIHTLPTARNSLSTEPGSICNGWFSRNDKLNSNNIRNCTMSYTTSHKHNSTITTTGKTVRIHRLYRCQK